MSTPPKDACIVTVATADHYLAGQQRLLKSVEKHGDGIAMLNWRGMLPPGMLNWRGVLPPGSPPHHTVPYAFKAYAIQEARRVGFTKVLWMDTSLYMMNGWDDFWEVLEERGNMFWHCDERHCGFSCADGALKILNRPREDLIKMPLVQGCIFALDFSNAQANKAWDYYWKHVHSGALIGPWSPKWGFVSTDPRVEGHRHDMPILSIACYDNKIDLLPQPYHFNYPGRDNPDNKHVCIEIERRPIP